MRPENEPKRGGRERTHIFPPQHGTWWNGLSKAARVAKEIVALGSGAFNHCAQNHGGGATSSEARQASIRTLVLSTWEKSVSSSAK